MPEIESRIRGRDGVYAAKADTEVSWFEAWPTVSLELLDAAAVGSELCSGSTSCGIRRTPSRPSWATAS